MNRAQLAGKVTFSVANPRDFCYDRHAKVDDVPYGGEPGMLIRAEPVAQAIESLGVEGSKIILTSPTGRRFDQSHARSLSNHKHLIFLCGHYEGIDQRIESAFDVESFSIGDFILTNGELPALVMADSVVRLLPGILGSAESLEADALSDGTLSAPNYTRPETWRGIEVPAVLRSGDHRAIQQWRRKRSLTLTRDLRPDLLARAPLSSIDLNMLFS